MTKTSTHHTDDIFKEKRKLKNPIKFGVTLNEEQKVAKSYMLDNPITAVRGKAGSGKAQPLHSKVYTPDGPIRMGDIKVGQHISGLNGPTEVLGIFPQGIEAVYTLTCSDGSQVEASGEHLWTVLKKKYALSEDKWEVKTTLELLESLKNGIEYRLPNAGEVSFNTRKLEVDPYLMGILLAEGHLSHGSIVFSTADDEVLSQVRETLEGTGTTLKKINDYDYRIKKTQRDNKPTSLVEYCRRENLTGTTSYSKFIPEDYKYNSNHNRTQLLRGLFDGDGYVDKKGRLFYNTSSKQLCQDVIEVVQSLGGRVTVLEYFPKYTYKGVKKQSLHRHYQLSITIVQPERFVTLTRKKNRLLLKTHKVKYLSRIIKNIEKTSETSTQCIKVAAEDSLYLTDNLIPTHNTLLAIQTGLDLLFNKQIEKLIIARPYVTAGEDLGFLPGGVDEKLSYLTAPMYNIMHDLIGKVKTEKLTAEGKIIVSPFGFLRGNTFSNCCVIIDEAQNATMRQTELMIGRLGRNSKMIFCGDMSQCDLRNKKDSGFDFFAKLELQVSGVKVFGLQQNHRHQIVDPVLDVFTTYRD